MLFILLFCLDTQITVKGTSVIVTKPDTMTWHFVLIHKNKEISKVAKEHDQAIQKFSGVFDDLKNGGQLQISRTELEGYWKNSYQTTEEATFAGYKARTNVYYHTMNLDLYRDIWLKVGALNDVEIQEVSFTTSKRTELQREVRVQAAMEAKKKAESYAQTLGVQLGPAFDIVENPDEVYRYYWHSGPPMINSISMDPSMGQREIEKAIEEGMESVTVSMSVQVKFLLEHSSFNEIRALER